MAAGTALAIGGASLLGGIGSSIINRNAARKAGEMQNEAAKAANALQWQMFEQQRADAEPWRQAGMGALTGMQDADFKRDFTAADFQKDPGYDFRMQEGQKALERSAAARGGLQSGGTMKALTQYGQNFASGEYQNAYNRFNADRDRRFNRLASLAGAGQTANSQIAAARSDATNAVTGNNLMAAQGMANAHMQGQGGWANLLGGLGGLAGGAQWMQMQQDALKQGRYYGGGAGVPMWNGQQVQKAPSDWSGFKPF
jgi:hypothetical protein